MPVNSALFENRSAAAQQLIEILPKKIMQMDDWLLVSISTQGIPIVDAIATKMNLDYDMLFSQPICAPNNKDCIIGMVSETEEIVLNNQLVDSFEINLDFIYGEAHRQYEEKILPRVYKYRKGDLIGSLKDKNVLLIDEGCETGMTVMAASKTVISSGAKTVMYTTPVIATDVAVSLEPVVDEIFAVEKVADFVDVDMYYTMLNELKTEDVLKIISQSKHYLPFQKTGEK